MNRSKSVPSGKQAWVKVITEAVRPCVIEPSIEHFHKHGLSTPSGIVHIEPGTKFQIYVANFGRGDTLFPKGMMLAYASVFNVILIQGTNIPLEEIVARKSDLVNIFERSIEKVLTADNRKFKKL